jgi:hypothetical protein
MLLPRRNYGRPVAAIVFLSVAGCYERRQSGEEAVYTFQWWVVLAVVAAGIALVVGGLLWTRRDRVRGIILAIAGVLAVAVGAPMFVLDRVTIGPDRLYLNTGYWFAPNRHEVHFSDVSRADVEAQVTPSRRGPKKSYFFIFHKKSGQTERVPIGDLMKEAYPEITERLRDCQIPLSLPPGEGG